MSSERNGVAFFDALKKKDGTFGEYVAPTSFFGEYVSKLEQQSGGSGNSAAEESSLEQPTTPHPKSTLPRWKRRTEQQIEANKLAQKRYREKKKAKLRPASAKVNTLQQQTQDFAALQDEVRSKERENLDLEAQLLTLEAELQQIRVGLDEKTPQGRFDAAAPPGFLSCFASPSLETKTESIGEKWAKAKHNLDQLLVENKLHPQNPQAVDKTLEKELQKRCSAAVQQCMEMLTWGGPALDDLLRTLPGGSEDLMRESTAERYVGLINELNLSVKQIDGIHEILRDVQQRLERIYGVRQELNSKVLSLLVVPTSSGAASDASSQAAQLRETLDQLEQNLAEEQRLESEHHYLLLRDTLTSLQGAYLINQTYPKHCDTLAFMQAVQKVYPQTSTGIYRLSPAALERQRGASK